MVPECVGSRRRCTCGRTGCPDVCSTYVNDEQFQSHVDFVASRRVDTKTYKKHYEEFINSKINTRKKRK